MRDYEKRTYSPQGGPLKPGKPEREPPADLPKPKPEKK
jgi:hypothetical protein